METNKAENQQDQPVSYSKRVLFGKSGKPGVSVPSAAMEADSKPVNQQTNTDTSAINDIHSQQFAKDGVAAKATIAGATFGEISKAKWWFWGRFWLRACYFLAAAVIIKFTLSLYTPDWMVTVYNMIKELPSLQFASKFSTSVVRGGYLLLFFFFSWIALSGWGLYDGLDVNYLRATASYLLVVKKAYSWGAAVFVSIVIITISVSFILYLLLCPRSTSSEHLFGTFDNHSKYDIIYYDHYGALVYVYCFILPGLAMSLVEGIVIFISMLLYKLSDEFKTNVHNVRKGSYD